MEDPSSGNTLLDISRVFADAEFRARKVAACKNPIIARFWNDIAAQATGDQALANYAPYVTNKFDAFTTNEIIRPIIAQQKSAFNFRDLMDNRKILLVNLAKGRIGELNANLLGLVIVGKFLIAAFRVQTLLAKSCRRFISISTSSRTLRRHLSRRILSEARKYKLSLTVAHQFIAQLTEEIRNAVFGNVGSIAAFRIGALMPRRSRSSLRRSFPTRPDSCRQL
jgi:tRNA isopentenyl-2-thiomethyl-A-37 hydroxylase MiaE